MKVILFAGKGKYFGSGHYTRLTFLQKILSHDFDTEFYEIENEKELAKKLQSLIYKENEKYFCSTFLSGLKTKSNSYLSNDIFKDIVIIKDCRDTSIKIYSLLKHFVTITLDDRYFPRTESAYRYIINAVPALKKRGNIVDIHGLLTPHYSISLDDALLEKYNCYMNAHNYRLVVTFGMDDYNDLSHYIADAVKDTEIEKYCLFILAEMKINNFKKKYPNINVIPSGNPDFIYILANAQCIVTHFGITSFEIYYFKKNKSKLVCTVKKNTDIVFVNPSRYHYRLTKKYFGDYYNLMRSRKNISVLIEIVKKAIRNSDNNDYSGPFKKSDEKKLDLFSGHRVIKNFLKYIQSMWNNADLSKITMQCPICNNPKQKPLQYNPLYTLFWCDKCKSIHRVDYGYSDVNQNEGKNYYFDQYKEFYGKTYEDDRDSIKILNSRRIEQIKKLINTADGNAKNRKISVLDVGCALGYFLDDFKSEMQNDYAEIKLYGSEINSYATDYCLRKGIIIQNKPIESMQITDTFDIISFWYVIEHTTDINRVMSKCYNVLKKNGIIAFSIPSVFGPEYVGNKKKYIVKRPPDHYFDFSPKSIRHLCRKHGFSIKHIEPAAYHFERFKQNFPLLSIIGKSLYKKLSEMILFSDTLFVYAQKQTM